MLKTIPPHLERNCIKLCIHGETELDRVIFLLPLGTGIDNLDKVRLEGSSAHQEAINVRHGSKAFTVASIHRTCIKKTEPNPNNLIIPSTQ